MKQRIIIGVVFVTALALGIFRFAAPQTAEASPNQVHIGVGIGIAPSYHHRRHHHRRTVIIAPRVIEHDEHHDRHNDHHDNGKHKGQEKHEDHGNDRH